MMRNSKHFQNSVHVFRDVVTVDISHSKKLYRPECGDISEAFSHLITVDCVKRTEALASETCTVLAHKRKRA